LIYKLQQWFHVELLLILDIINSGPTFRSEPLGKFSFSSHTVAVAATIVPTQMPPFLDLTPLGLHEELQTPPSVKSPSPSMFGNCFHRGSHLRPPSTPGFATTGSDSALRLYVLSGVAVDL
jgi:hypothetical protein